MNWIVVGSARSGTKSIVELMKLLGYDAWHQCSPGPKASICLPYNLDQPPSNMMEYVNLKVGQIKQFEAHYALSYFVHPIGKLRDDVRFLVMVRSPLMACNSWCTYWNRQGKQPPQPVEYFALLYIRLYRFLLTQAKRMKCPPKFLRFDRYCRGEYLEPLAALYDVPLTDDLRRRAMAQLAVRVNHVFGYEPVDCEAFVEADMVVRQLMDYCEELGA